MQKDFHHAVTYTVARLAGFDHAQAQLIGWSAQYVDDAVSEGVIDFSNGTQYRYIASAHKDLDRRNFREQANRKVWIPFHFVPGNKGKAPKIKSVDQKAYRHKLITLKNSHPVRDMVNECIKARNEPWGLHLFGIAMHVFADTWAHQDFIGKIDKYNFVRILDHNQRIDQAFADKLKAFFRESFDEMLGRFVSGILPLGHASALSFPDLPYLEWSYRRKDKTYLRSNPREYTQAVKHMYRAMRRYLAGHPQAVVNDLGADVLDKFQYYFRKFDNPSAEHRHQEWQTLLRNGEFGFRQPELLYAEQGELSWVFQATGIRSEQKLHSGPLPPSEAFAKSNWKLFRDALLIHRFNLINKILPEYGILEPYA